MVPCMRVHVHRPQCQAPLSQLRFQVTPGVVPVRLLPSVEGQGQCALGGQRPLLDGWPLRPGRGAPGQRVLDCGMSEP